MGILNKLFGFRWSLYIVRDGNKLTYAMHENSVLRILGYVMNYYKNGKKPVEPWSLYLNFNHKHQAFQLLPEHFTPEGDNVTSLLIKQVEEIDPKWKVQGGEPVFEDAVTKKRLKISEHISGKRDLQAMIDNIDKSRDITFFRVMDEVFGKSR